jgi:hypothetical protein
LVGHKDLGLGPAALALSRSSCSGRTLGLASAFGLGGGLLLLLLLLFLVMVLVVIAVVVKVIVNVVLIIVIRGSRGLLLSRSSGGLLGTGLLDGNRGFGLPILSLILHGTLLGSRLSASAGLDGNRLRLNLVLGLGLVLGSSILGGGLLGLTLGGRLLIVVVDILGLGGSSLLRLLLGLGLLLVVLVSGRLLAATLVGLGSRARGLRILVLIGIRSLGLLGSATDCLLAGLVELRVLGASYQHGL